MVGHSIGSDEAGGAALDDAGGGEGHGLVGEGDQTTECSEAAREAQAFVFGSHIDSASASGRALSVKERLVDAFKERDSSLTDEQAGHAASLAAPLCGEAAAPHEVSAIISVCVAYERQLAKAGGPRPAAPTSTDVEATERLADYLRGECDTCREATFGSVATPFATLNAAAEWARSESSRHSLAGSERAAIEEQLRQLESATDSPVRIEHDWKYVLLRDPDEAAAPPSPTPAQLGALMGLQWFFPANRSPALGELSDVQRRLSEQVGVDEWEITRFILLGWPPAVRRWRPRVPEARWLQGSPGVPLWFTIEVRDRRLSYEEIREMFADLVRDGLLEPTTSSADQRAKLERLRRFVSERRDLTSPPMAWADITREWDEANPSEHFTPRAIQRAYAKARELAGEAKPPVVRGRRRRRATPQ